MPSFGDILTQLNRDLSQGMGNIPHFMLQAQQLQQQAAMAPLERELLQLEIQQRRKKTVKPLVVGHTIVDPATGKMTQVPQPATPKVATVTEEAVLAVGEGRATPGQQLLARTVLSKPELAEERLRLQEKMGEERIRIAEQNLGLKEARLGISQAELGLKRERLALAEDRAARARTLTPQQSAFAEWLNSLGAPGSEERKKALQEHFAKAGAKGAAGTEFERLHAKVEKGETLSKEEQSRYEYLAHLGGISVQVGETGGLPYERRAYSGAKGPEYLQARQKIHQYARQKGRTDEDLKRMRDALQDEGSQAEQDAFRDEMKFLKKDLR